MITLDSKRTISYSIDAMNFVSLSFLSSLLFLAFFVTNQVSAKPGNSKTKPIKTKKCNNIYFYEAPNKKMETMLKDIKKQLAHMQTDINILKGKQNPKAKRNCAELYKSGQKVSGVYAIDPDAEYDLFAVTSEKAKYQLSLGTYSGTAGDSLSGHRGSPFTTKDQDNDTWSSNCAVKFKGAWWYTNCHGSNLNGVYHHGKHSSYADGVNWYSWKGHHYSAKRAEMKIRPVKF